MVSVVAAIIIDGDKVLLAKRKAEKRLGGLWEFPGGKMEPGETPEETIVREIKEELDIDVTVESYFSENVHQYDFGTIKLIAYVCRYAAGKFSFKDHSEVRWVNIDDLYDYEVAQADRVFVKRIMQKIY